MDASYFKLSAVAEHLRDELRTKQSVLIFAYNGTGKTRLSGAFRDLGRVVQNGETKDRDTLYFNAYTEDLFTWDNDIENEREPVLELNDNSKFFDGLRQLEMEVKIGKFLSRYTDLNFRINYDRRRPRKRTESDEERLPPGVVFFRERAESGEPIPIKISRGEENIFIWCFFLAIVQLALDGAEAYKWVRYVYIDDPVSSLDEHNAIAIANHLAQILSQTAHGPQIIVSTHHVLFFNVLCNEMRKPCKYLLTREQQGRGYTMQETDSTPFLQHLSSLVDLHEAQRTGKVYTHHFNTMRRVMEQTANFFGMNSWKDCVKPEANDPDKTLYERVINLMSHGDYSVFEAKEMMPENKKLFRAILKQFVTIHPFGPKLLAHFAD
jgi:hypothetical protein